MLQIREFDLKTGRFLTDYDPITKSKIFRTKDVEGSYLEDWLSRQKIQGEQAQFSVAQFYDGVNDRDVQNVLDRGQQLVFTSGKYGYFAPPGIAKALLEDSPIYDNGLAAAHNAVAYGSLIISDGFSQTRTDTGKVKILLVDNINRSLGEKPLLDKYGQPVPVAEVEQLLDVMGDGTMLIPSSTMENLLLPDEISTAIEIGLKKAQIEPIPDLIRQLQNEYESEGKIRLSNVNLRGANAINNEIALKTERTVLQFRAALSDVPGIAKGTLKTSESWTERLGVDAIISLDDVKGATKGGVFDRPGVIELKSDLWINRKDIARYGTQSVGSQVKYKIPRATKLEFNPKMIAQAQELATLAIDPYALAQRIVEQVERQRERPLYIDPLEESLKLEEDLPSNKATGETVELKEDLLITEETVELEEDFLSNEAIALVIKNDRYGQIVQLPFIATQLKKSLQSQWLDAATVGIEVPSAMAQHHAALKPWEVCNKDLPDGAIVAYYRSPFGNVGAAAIAINNPFAIESADPESYNKDGVSYLPPWTAKNIAITDFDSDRNGYFIGFIAKDPQMTIEGLRNKLNDISDPALQYTAGRTEIDRLIVAGKDLEVADYPYAVGEFVKANRPENMPMPIPKDKKVLHPRLAGEHLSVSIGKAWCITAQNPVGKVASQSMILESLAQNITYTQPDRSPALLSKIIKTFGEIDPASIPTDEMLKDSGLPALNLASRIKSVLNSELNNPNEGLKQIVSILEDYAKYPMAKNLQTAVDIAKSNQGIDEDFQDFASQLAYQKHEMRMNMRKPEIYLSSPLKNNTVDPVGAAVNDINKIFNSVPEIKIDRKDLNRGFRSIVPDIHDSRDESIANRMINKYRETSNYLAAIIGRLKEKNPTDLQPILVVTSLNNRTKIEVINLCDGEKENPVNLLALNGKQSEFLIDINEAAKEQDVPAYLLRDAQTKVVIGFIDEKSLKYIGQLDSVNKYISEGSMKSIEGKVETFTPYFLQNDTDKINSQLEIVLADIKSKIKGKEDVFLSAFQHSSIGQNLSVKIMPKELTKHLREVDTIQLYGVKEFINLENASIRFDNAIIDGSITPIASLITADREYEFLGAVSKSSPTIAPGTVVKANISPLLARKTTLNILDKKLQLTPGTNVEIPLQSGQFNFRRIDDKIAVYLLSGDSQVFLGDLDKASTNQVQRDPRILQESIAGTYQRGLFRNTSGNTELDIKILSLVEHLPVSTHKIIMSKNTDKSFSLESAPPEYYQATIPSKLVESTPDLPTQIIPSKLVESTLDLPNQTIPSKPVESTSSYMPSRLELVNWYKAVGGNSESGKQLLELGKQLKISYMAEDFMDGKAPVDLLPDDYRNSNILISVIDKNNFDLAIESLKELAIESKTNTISR
jgi:hypothetical protein